MIVLKQIQKLSKNSLTLARNNIAISLFLFVALGISGNILMSSAFADNVSVNNVLIDNKKTIADYAPQTGFADLIEKVSPAVVHVSISGTVNHASRGPQFNFPPGSPFEDFFEQFRQQQPAPKQNKKQPLGIGSGFVISADGYVVTNYHVIKDADEITVTLSDGQEFEAELKGSDRKTDLALLKVNAKKELLFVNWGDDSESRVGDWVLAIGNPFGLGGTATTGIISARGRDIQSGPYDDYIQVDAAINRGNSGGPLFNLDGKVIGINTAIYSPNGGSVGIGFSIPSSMAQKVIKQLKEVGEVERGWIGVQIQELSDELAEGFNRKNNYGALVSSIVPDTPAAKSGLLAGDIILSFDGNEIKEMRDLPKLVAQTEVGKKVDVAIWRDGKMKTLSLKIERFPEDEEIAATGSSSSSKLDNELGAELKALNDNLKKQYGLDDSVQGVIVADVNPGGLAAENGVRPGDILIRIGSKTITKVSDVTVAIKQAREQKKQKLVLLIQRKNNNRFITFDLSDE